MKKSLVVRWRTYWDNKHGQYVGVKSVTGESAVVFDSPFYTSGTSYVFDYAVDVKHLRYASPQDFDLCYELACAARMNWFNPGIDDKTGTEFNWDTESGKDFRKRKSSFRKAVKVMSEGLIDQDFLKQRCPADAEFRFRGLVKNMGFEDPGPYLKELE